MKNIFIILFLLISASVSAQFSVTQTTGAPTTLVKSRGGQGADSGFIVPNIDTALIRQLNYYDGLSGKGSGLVFFNGLMYYRYNGYWYAFSTTGRDTTIFVPVIDSTGLSGYKVPYAVNNHFEGSTKFVYEPTYGTLNLNKGDSNTLGTVNLLYVNGKGTIKTLITTPTAGYPTKDTIFLMLNANDSVVAITKTQAATFFGGGGGSGTVTSVATNNSTGITGGTITTTGTLAIDTNLISTRLWRQKGIDSLSSIISTKGSGTVTSVATGYGLSGGTITTSGTLIADTSSSTGLVSKDRLTNTAALKVNISDTSNMLTPYLRKIDTASLSGRINLKVNISDTSTMLSPYLRKIDTTGKWLYDITAGTNISIDKTNPQKPIISASGGAVADSSWVSAQVGTAKNVVGQLVNQNFTGITSLPSSWETNATPSSLLTLAYTGNKLNVTGGAFWGAPATNSNTLSWRSGIQYKTERMPYEKITFKITLIPLVKESGNIFAVTFGSNGFSLTARPTIAWDLSTSGTSGRVGFGTDSLVTWVTGSDSTSKLSFSANDTLDLQFVKDGFSVIATSHNRNTGKTTITYYNGIWNSIGGKWNMIFLSGNQATTDYVVTNVTISSNSITNGALWFGDSHFSGSNASSESRRTANLVMRSNYKYYSMVGLPAGAAKYMVDDSVQYELLQRLSPSVVLIGFGHNDLVEGLTPAQANVYIDSIGQQWARKGASIVVSPSIWNHASSSVMNDSLTALCSRRGWRYSTNFSNISGQTTPFSIFNRLSSDGLHQNDTGYVYEARNIEAVAGDLILQAMAIDTNYVLQLNQLPTGQTEDAAGIVAVKSNGTAILIPNDLGNPSAKYIVNQNLTGTTSGTNNPLSRAQGNSRIHVSGYIRTDTAFQANSVQGLRIGFNNDDATSTTGANINITNAGLGGTGYPQAYDNMTGAGNIKIIASSANKTKAAMSATISGNNNLILNGLISGTLSGSGNIILNSYTALPTSNSNNFFAGVGGGKGITTGSNNLDWDIDGNGPSTNVSNTMFWGSNQYGFTNDNKQTGDIGWAITGGGATQYWFGGRASGSAATMNMTGLAAGTDTRGLDWTWRAGRGRGAATSGSIIFQTYNAGSSGTALNTTTNTELTIANDSVQIDAMTKHNMGVQYKTNTSVSTGANYAVTTSDYYIELPDLTAAAARNIVLPATGSGRELVVTNLNNSANNWSFSSGTVNDAAGNAVTTLTNQKSYRLIYNGTLWRVVSVY